MSVRRARSDAPPRRPVESNAWERGIALDHRGLPFRDEYCNPIPLKRFAEKRSYWESQLHRTKAGALTKE